MHDVSGMTCFPEEKKVLEILSIFNSTVAKYLLTALNPTIHYQVGDIERLPIPDTSSEILDKMVKEAIEIAKQDSAESEITYDFSFPPKTIASVDERHAEVRRIEEEIDKEVTRLYGLKEKDRLTLRAELNGAIHISEEADEISENDDADNTESAWSESSTCRRAFHN